MTLNLCNESQFLFILETSASLTQAIIITDIVDVLFEHHDQDTTLLDVVISLFKSNIRMSFESIASSTLVVFTELALTLLDQISYNNRREFQLNLMKSLVQR